MDSRDGTADAGNPSEAARVLLIEDNSTDAFLLQEWVAEKAGDRFAMERASRLATALERLAEKPFDLVVLDLTLPDSKGWDTFSQVRKAVPHLALIVMSGLDDEALALKTVQKGAQDYLVKGQVDASGLIRSMRYAIERRQAEKALAEERNLLRILLDNLPDPIYVKDTAGHYILDNKAHLKLLGIKSSRDLHQKTVDDFFPPGLARQYKRDDSHVLETGQAIVDRSERHDTLDGNEKWALTTKVPLRSTEGKILGLVGISRDVTEQKQAEDQLARSNAELRAKNKQLEDDQRMAREIQQALLPHQYPIFPHTAKAEESALQFCHYYRPTDLVGGDFYHVLPLSDTAAGIFIADVMGHGVRSALATAILRTLVEEIAALANDPGGFLHEINRALSAILTRTGTLMFATAIYLIADVEKMEIRFANAGGHPPPLRIRRDVERVQPIISVDEEPGPALGLLENAAYKTFASELALNDLLFFFTDGLYEVESPEGNLYGLDRLCAAVDDGIHLPAPKLFEKLLREITTFSHHDFFLDDVCLVGMEVTGRIRHCHEPDPPE